MPNDTNTTSSSDAEEALANAIDAWHEDALRNGLSVPDFWDECDTSGLLAAWLIAEGWKKP